MDPSGEAALVDTADAALRASRRSSESFAALEAADMLEPAEDGAHEDPSATRLRVAHDERPRQKRVSIQAPTCARLRRVVFGI